MADITSYAVSKKDFDVKQVEIVVADAQGGVKERRVLVAVPDKPCLFRLTDTERQSGVSVYVMDRAERVIAWRYKYGFSKISFS